MQARPWEDNHLVREIRSPAVRKHRIGAPCHGHHDPGRDDQPPAEDSGMAARGPGQSRPRVEVISVEIGAGREAFLPVIQAMPASLRNWGDPGV